MDSVLAVVLHNKVFIAIAVLLALNIVTGVADSLYHHMFALGNLADWLLSRALPYVIVDVALQIVIVLGVGDSVPELAPILGGAVHGFVVLTLIGKILDNIHSMGFANLPMAVRNTPAAKVEIKP